MQFKIATIAFFVTSSLAAATPLVARGGGGTSCSTGPIQCCNSVQAANSPAVLTLLSGLLGLLVGPITGQVGLTCSPLTVIGLGGNQCTGQTVCCDNNNFNGLIALGCTNINIL